MTRTAHMAMIDMRTSYVILVRELLRNGEEVTVREDKTIELVDVELRFDTPGRPMLPLGIGRRINTKLAAVETLSLLAGAVSRDLVMAAAPSYAQVLVSQDEADFAYAAYGPRVAPQFDTVVSQLAADPTSRQAVLSIWKKVDLYHRGDRPCTLTIQFLIRGDALHMIVNMRSNDVWRGLGYDAFVFSQLHWTMHDQLTKMYPELRMGAYHHHAASLHLYERDFEAARSLSVVVQTEPPALPYGVVSPRGWFPDQVARTLLDPDPTRPRDMLEAQLANPWYAARLREVEATLEATR